MLSFLRTLSAGVGPQPHASPSPDAWQPAPNLELTAAFLIVLFGLPMLWCLWTGADLIADWLNSRESARRP